jgi:hypothetical protein
MQGQAASKRELPLENIGRRAAPRLRLSIPARITTLFSIKRCVLIDLSQSGAQIGIERPMPVGEPVMLKVADLEQFGEVVRGGPGTNGIAFDDRLSHEDVLDIRRFSESMEYREREQLWAEARAWVHGPR